jgi:hypothetical protein
MPKSIFRAALFTALLTLLAYAAKAQEIEYKEYSYTEFFKMIEDEEDSVFRLRNAFIIPDETTDKRFYSPWSQNSLDIDFTPKDTIFIDKIIDLNNVRFAFGIKRNEGSYEAAYLSFIHFEKKVLLKNVANFFMAASTFDEFVEIQFYNNLKGLLDTQKSFPSDIGPYSFGYIQIQQNNFKKGVSVKGRLSEEFPLSLTLYKNTIECTIVNGSYTGFFIGKIMSVAIGENHFKGDELVSLNIAEPSTYYLTGNTFEVPAVLLYLRSLPNSTIDISKNEFKGRAIFSIDDLSDNINLEWTQFEGKAFSDNVYQLRNNIGETDSLFIPDRNIYTVKNLDYYANRYSFENGIVYKAEQRLRGKLMSFYKAQNDSEYANAVYMESKDLETKRLAYLYQVNPTFDTFFTWRINQFLKVFSAYGTKPAKAIIFSVWVIFAFATVYLFFPNHWDSYGKSRLKHRFSFFYKYMSLNAGIQDVYLEENKAEIEDNEAFKSLLEAHKEQAPKLFFNLAMPLYRWSMAGTLTYAWLIKRFDFLKGTWKDTDPKVRGLKSFLIGFMFIIALIYDIFIKMLNALMLSINTFTTLGFGEIPIKGLPRYLAIIQGFIGWFMLTIFSVSLISQLLN